MNVSARSASWWQFSQRQQIHCCRILSLFCHWSEGYHFRFKNLDGHKVLLVPEAVEADSAALLFSSLHKKLRQYFSRSSQTNHQASFSAPFQIHRSASRGNYILARVASRYSLNCSWPNRNQCPPCLLCSIFCRCPHWSWAISQRLPSSVLFIQR